MDKVKLEACPFCGGEAVAPTHDDEFEAWRCGCSLCNAHTWADTEAQAIAAWNTRPTPEPSGEVIQADRDAAFPFIANDFRPGDAYSTGYYVRRGERDDHPLVQAFKRHRLTQGAALTDQWERDGRCLLEAVAASQEVQPYRGWNLTKLNEVAGQIRAHLGLPSVRDLNPEIAKMQDAAEVNKDTIRDLIAEPSGEERSTAGLIDDSESLESWGELRDDPDAIVKCADRWRLIANSIGCTLHGFDDGRVASFVTPDGNTIEVGPKFRATLTPPPSDAVLREALGNITFLTCVSGDGPTPYLKVHFNDLAAAHAAHDALIAHKQGDC